MTRYIYDRQQCKVIPAPVSNKKVQADAILESNYTPEETANWMFGLPTDEAIKLGKEWHLMGMPTCQIRTVARRHVIPNRFMPRCSQYHKSSFVGSLNDSMRLN